MKQYLSQNQTARLIELRFEKPKYECLDKTLRGIEKWNNIQSSYSIGELLLFLPPIIPQESGYYINVTHDSVSWVIDYKQHGDTQYKYIVSDVELIDALFAVIIKLKAEGVI